MSPGIFRVILAAMDEIKEDISQYLSEDEVDALGEIGNIAMGTSATTMSAILGHRVLITTPQVELFKPENALTAYRCPFLAVTVGYLNGLQGKNLLILKEYDAAVITDVMMGGDGNIEWNRASSLSEIHFSAISEIMNQMIGSSATAMSNMLGVTVNITPPQAVRIDVGEDVSTLMGPSKLLIRTSFDMEIEGVLKSTLLQIMRVRLGPRFEQGDILECNIRIDRYGIFTVLPTVGCIIKRASPLQNKAGESICGIAFTEIDPKSKNYLLKLITLSQRNPLTR